MSGAIQQCSNCAAKVRVPSRADGHPRCPKCHADLPWLVDADESDFSATVLSSTIPVLVDCWAPWCQPCVAFAPALAQTAAKWAGQLKVVKVNVDEAPRISEKYGVRSIPTVLLFRDGELVAERIGATNANGLDMWLRSTLTDNAKS